MRFDFRFGIAFSLILILGGANLYFYSTQTQVSTPTEVPYTTFTAYQKRNTIPIYPTEHDHLHIQNTINPQESLQFGYYDAKQYQFNEILFYMDETSTSVTVSGLLNGIVWVDESTNHGVKYISVYSNGSNSVYIYNPSPSHAVYVGGVISFSKITHETIQVPYTAYRTEYVLSTTRTHPYQNLGGILLTIGVLAGIATAIFTLISRRRIKEAL